MVDNGSSTTATALPTRESTMRPGAWLGKWECVRNHPTTLRAFNIEVARQYHPRITSSQRRISKQI
jgi:hypothetical protein